jgi:hypothetical protein
MSYKSSNKPIVPRVEKENNTPTPTDQPTTPVSQPATLTSHPSSLSSDSADSSAEE